MGFELIICVWRRFPAGRAPLPTCMAIVALGEWGFRDLFMLRAILAQYIYRRVDLRLITVQGQSQPVEL